MATKIPQNSLIKLNNKNTEVSLFIIHGIEGNTDALLDFAGVLPVSVYGLQNTKSVPSNSVESMALYYKQLIEDHCSQKQNILICGYSAGSSVAYHIACLLAEKGWTSTLILLDGSPAYVTARMDRLVYKYSRGLVNNEEDRLWLVMIHSFLKFIVELDTHEFLVRILNEKEHGKKVKIFTETLVKEGVSKTEGDALFSVESYFNRLKMSDDYWLHSCKSYPGDVTLIKSEDSKNLPALGKDYKLGEVVTGQVTVYEVEGSHWSFLKGTTAKYVANIIIKTLDLQQKL